MRKGQITEESILNRAIIRQAVINIGPARWWEIAEAVGLTSNAVCGHLAALHDQGEIEHHGVLWYADAELLITDPEELDGG